MPFDSHNSHLKQVGVSANGYSPAIGNDFPRLSYAGVFKRLFDITLVVLSAPIVVPFIAIMALLVSLDGRAPFYTQLRVGRGGRLFRIVKMRTMVHNADALLQEQLSLDPALREEWDTTQKLKRDVRVTRIGRILRKTSMDELPQLFNVLSGSMSLVGPRPMMPDQQALYPGNAYYQLRPGITGFWQISDRNHCNFCDRAKYDTAYERSVSLRTDLTVLWRTVMTVLNGTGY